MIKKIGLKQAGLIYISMSIITIIVHLLVIWGVIFWGEFRLRALQLSFTETHIEVKPFFGLGTMQVNNYESISGFETMLQPALPLPYECLILSNGAKELVRISQFYFSNYSALKKIVTEKCKDQGMKRFTLKRAFTEIFEK